MKAKLSIILTLFISLNLYSQCSCVRGGNVKFVALDTLNHPASVFSYTFTVYYDALTFCGDTVFFSKQYANNKHLKPFNGTDINGDGVLDGVLINPNTRMCLFKTMDTIVISGYQTPTFKAGYYVPGISNIPNSGNVNFSMSPQVFVSTNLQISDLKSIVFQGASTDTNSVGINYNYNPLHLQLDNDSINFSIVPCAAGATNPVSSTSFSINPGSGIVTWNAPTTSGLNNIRIKGSDNVHNFSTSSWTNNGNVFSEVQVLTKAGTTGINLFETIKAPFVFPNPTTNKIHIVNNNNLPSGLTCEVKIRDIMGKEIKSFPVLFSSEIIIDVAALSTGEYVYEISDKNTVVQKGKFIKQ